MVEGFPKSARQSIICRVKSICVSGSSYGKKKIRKITSGARPYLAFSPLLI